MTNLGLLAAALLSLAIFGCAKASDSDDDDNGGSADIPALYKDFANYPTGRQSASGLLTLTNEVNSAVLVFTDSVSAQNYIGTIPALSSITVSLPAGKFYSIVAVTKNAYEENQTLAAQSSVLAYYSNLQAYSVSVSPEDLTGSATWIFNNNTNYWVSVEKTDNSGDTYAVIAPNAKRVSIPVQKNQSYDYKVVYKKQLKYRNNIIAVSNITSMEDNDTASFMNLTTFTTDLNGNKIDIPKEYYYLTCHREENTRDDNVLTEILLAMNSLDYKTIYPVHPRNRERAKRICEENHLTSITLTNPVGYLESINLTKSAKKIVTDSGGLQCEAFFAQVQCVTVYEKECWPETMVENRNQLAKPDKNDIISKLSKKQSVDINYKPFGDGTAAIKIVDEINKWGGVK